LIIPNSNDLLMSDLSLVAFGEVGSESAGGGQVFGVPAPLYGWGADHSALWIPLVAEK